MAQVVTASFLIYWRQSTVVHAGSRQWLCLRQDNGLEVSKIRDDQHILLQQFQLKIDPPAMIINS